MYRKGNDSWCCGLLNGACGVEASPKFGDPSCRQGDGSDRSVNGTELAELKVYPVELRGIF